MYRKLLFYKNSTQYIPTGLYKNVILNTFKEFAFNILHYYSFNTNYYILPRDNYLKNHYTIVIIIFLNVYTICVLQTHT